MINPQWLKLLRSTTKFHGPKGAESIEVQLQFLFHFPGGEGCNIASGGALIGLGSDIGGSIRMPAFFNGIFGHRPSKSE